MIRGKKAVSPLVATVLLIAFAVALGAVVMNWGKAYIEEKAEFVSGAADTIGCEGVEFGIIEISEVSQLCRTDSSIEALIENGAVALENIRARVIGTDGIYTQDSILKERLESFGSVKTRFPFAESIGKLLQVKFTPKIDENGELITCTEEAVVFEDTIRPCE